MAEKVEVRLSITARLLNSSKVEMVTRRMKLAYPVNTLTHNM